MSFQPAVSVKKALEAIHRHEYVLPAIQREFQWSQEQICRLFDSLLRGYPMGSFLFWKVEKKNVPQYSFYDFVLHYHQKNAAHCPALEVPADSPVTAVLDGQQRLTALNIGLRGSHAIKEPRKWWDNPGAFERKQLWLNLLATAPENEQGMHYDFRFLSEARAGQRDEGQCWFPVARILHLKAGPEMHKFLVEQGLGSDNAAFERLHRLYEAVHSDPVIHYYLEEHQELDHVLDIFIRVNSGGTVLSFSDLLLSIATAEWSHIDARARIHTLVDELNQTGSGFGFTKDFVLKAGLMLTDIASVGFRVTNFNRANMQILEECWMRVETALKLTARFAADCGFSRENLAADSPFLVVAYYLYQRDAAPTYLTSASTRDDREALRSWIVRSLLKPGVWGSGLDTTLTALRTILKQHGTVGWPGAEIEQEMSRRGRSLRFEEEEIEDLIDVRYGDRRTFALLSLLYPYVDFRNVFHLDHVFPRSRFRQRELLKVGVSREQIDGFQDRVDRLANLQLLEGPFNQSKNDVMPDEWLKLHLPDERPRAAYIERHDLGVVPQEMVSFGEFYEARRQKIGQRLRHLLSA